MDTGHSKNVTNYETLIISCTGYGADYNPSNPDISIQTLTDQYNEAKKSINEVKATETKFGEIEGQRQTIFKPLKPTATKILNALKSSGAPSTVIADGETINRKIQGKRADNTTEVIKDEPKDRNSVMQQSYDMKLDNLEKLIELVNIEPKYNPNEEPLKVDTLIKYKEQLEKINTKVKTAYVPYKNAMDARDLKLYTPETGLVDTAKKVKTYVKSVFGAKSPQYKQISGLKFTKIKY